MKYCFLLKNSRITMCGLYFLLTCSCFCQQVLELDYQNTTQEKINLKSYLKFTESGKSSWLSLDENIQKMNVNQNYFFCFSVRNQTNDTLQRVLQFGNPYVTARQIQVASDLFPKPKLYPEPTNTVFLRLAPHEKLLVSFRLNELNRADPGKLSILLISKKKHFAEVQTSDKAQSFFLGLFLFLVIFNLILFIVTWWKLYIQYSIYIFSSLLYFAYYFGWLQRIFPELNHLSLNLVYTWYSIIFITYFIFLNHFGNYKQYVPRAHKLLNIGIVYKSVETLAKTLLHITTLEFIYNPWFSNTALCFEILLMSAIVFYIIKNKSVRGRLVIVASLFLITGGIIEQSKLFHDFDNTYFIEIGITAELLTFSVGLGYITKAYYDEKRAAEQRYIEQLLYNQNLQKDITNQLELKVAQRTEELNQEKIRVEKKNNENELLLTEIHHRVKNNLQVISSLLSLQERNIDNKEAKLAILESKERIRSMELVHRMLYHSNNYGEIEVNEYVRTLSSGLTDSFGFQSNDLTIHLDFPKLYLDLDTVILLGLILNELLINSLKHAKIPNQTLVVKIGVEKTDGEDLLLFFSDNGNGSLEKVESSNSFGFKIIRALVHQLEGKMEIIKNKGLEYRIVFKPYKRIT